MASDKSNPPEGNPSHKHLDDLDSVFKGAHKLQPNDFDDGQYVVQDSISSETDIDIWRFHLNEGEMVTVDTNTFLGGFTPDTIVALFDNNGGLLAVNDDDGSTYESFLQYTAEEDGNYFLGVSQYPSFPTGGGDFAHGGPEYGPTDFWTGPGPYELLIDIA
jgi:hypothetical protein